MLRPDILELVVPLTWWPSYIPPLLLKLRGSHPCIAIGCSLDAFVESQEVSPQGLIKEYGRVLNPCGNVVQVSWPLNPPLGSVHSKAKMGLLISVRGRQKKASLTPELCTLVSLVAGDWGGVRNHGMDDVYSFVDLSEILH